jgi:hypothetical protein
MILDSRFDSRSNELKLNIGRLNSFDIQKVFAKMLLECRSKRIPVVEATHFRKAFQGKFQPRHFELIPWQNQRDNY